MMQNANLALSRPTLLDKVWGMDSEADERVIDTHMKMLRRDLGDWGAHIVTIRGVGYKFDRQ